MDAEYMRDYRRRKPESLLRQRRRQQIRAAAIKALIERYPKEFQQLLSAAEKETTQK